MTLSAAQIETEWVEYQSLSATVRAFLAAPFSRRLSAAALGLGL